MLRLLILFTVKFFLSSFSFLSQFPQPPFTLTQPRLNSQQRRIVPPLPIHRPSSTDPSACLLLALIDGYDLPLLETGASPPKALLNSTAYLPEAIIHRAGPDQVGSLEHEGVET